MSWPDWLDLQRNSTLVEEFIGEKITGTTLSIGDRAERASGSMVSANYFDAIGVRPMLGRGFVSGEDAGRNAHPVTVISYQMCQDRFHGDPAVIGKTQVLSGLPHTIVGVTPKGFYGTFVGYAFQFQERRKVRRCSPADCGFSPTDNLRPSTPQRPLCAP